MKTNFYIKRSKPRPHTEWIVRYKTTAADGCFCICDDEDNAKAVIAALETVQALERATWSEHCDLTPDGTVIDFAQVKNSEYCEIKESAEEAIQLIRKVAQ